MAAYSAYSAGATVEIQVSVPIEVAPEMGLAVLIITISPVVSLVLLVVLIHSGDVFLVYLYSDLLHCERCIPLEDCWIA